jgi:hypothetical protein
VERGLVLTRFSRKEMTKEGEEDAQGVTMLLAAMAVMATIILALLMLASAALVLEVIEKNRRSGVYGLDEAG